MKKTILLNRNETTKEIYVNGIRQLEVEDYIVKGNGIIMFKVEKKDCITLIIERITTII